MNKELLSMIGAMIPYGLYCSINNENKPYKALGMQCNGKIALLIGNKVMNYHIDEVKPYLRPMEDLSENEIDYIDNLFYINPGDVLMWLVRHKVDHQGFIDQGLALKSVEGMYEDK